jgi:hypothetical protein
MFLTFMTCACNYLCLIYMDGIWVGVPLVADLGYGADVWPLASGLFCKVWGHVMHSPLNFLLHLVVGAVFDQEERPSGNFIFKKVQDSSSCRCLGAFPTFIGFCCAVACDGKFGGTREGYAGVCVCVLASGYEGGYCNARNTNR